MVNILKIPSHVCFSLNENHVNHINQSQYETQPRYIDSSLQSSNTAFDTENKEKWHSNHKIKLSFTEHNHKWKIWKRNIRINLKTLLRYAFGYRHIFFSEEQKHFLNYSYICLLFLFSSLCHETSHTMATSHAAFQSALLQSKNFHSEIAKNRKKKIKKLCLS